MTQLQKSFKQYEETTHKMISFLEENDHTFYWTKPSSEKWSVMQIVSHVTEAIPFWRQDVEGLLIEPTGRWGRNHEHVGRLVAVNEEVVRQKTVKEVINQLTDESQRVEMMFKKLQPEHLIIQAPSYNVNFEGKPLSFIIDHLIVGHIQSHYEQMVRHYEEVKQ